MKVTLIQPEIIAGKSLGIRKEPSSIKHLGGQLKHEGFEVFMKHAPVDESLIRWIVGTDTRIVGISTMTANFREGEKLATILKQANPDIKIILGGWHASGCAKAYSSGQESETISEILGANSPFDYMIAGEGELALPALVRRINSGAALDGVEGLGYFDGKIILNKPAIVRSLDSVADPSYEGIDISGYRDMRSGDLDLSIHFQRGCPWACGFCATETVSGKALRSLSIERVVSQLIHIAETFKPQVITFTNEDPLLDLGYFRKLVARLNEIGFYQKYGIKIDIFASVVDIHRMMTNPAYDGMMREMKSAGISSFTVGVESFNPIVLRKYGKIPMILALMSQDEKERFSKSLESVQDSIIPGIYYERICSTVTYAYSHGIPCTGDYMIGNPGETEDEVKKGFELFSKIPNLLTAYLPKFTPFPGTKVWKECYPHVVRGTDGRIAWEKFDASESAYSSGLRDGLRDNLELAFYTSERYAKDMISAIKSRIIPVESFLGRFRFIADKFSGNPLVERAEKIIEKLQSLEK